MIGTCTESAIPSVDQGTIRAIFGFSNKYEFIEAGASLEPGKGYWINLSEPTTLRVEKGE
ncbi:MAG: hypothetical protein ACMUIA_04965 [bacterium]